MYKAIGGNSVFVVRVGNHILIVKGRDLEVSAINIAEFDKETLISKIEERFGEEARDFVKEILEEDTGRRGK